jgi:origin recognition complex subunit 4
MKDVCEEIFVESRDVREFFNKSIPIISSLSFDEPLPAAKAWTSSIMSPESKLSLVDGLSQLELGLLISATRLETFHALETFNFNMVYEIYTSLISRARTQLSASVTALGVQTVIPGGAVQLWGRDVAFRAWERLGEIGLWQYSGRGEGRGRFVRCEIDLIELSAYCDKKKVLHSAMKSWFKDGI